MLAQSPILDVKRYRICPNPFYQLCIIHCWFRGRCIPVINALLLSATFETYAGLFEFLAEHIRNRALIVVKEMELAAENAFMTQLINANLNNVSTFLSWPLEDNWRGRGHSEEYVNNPDFARSFRKFSALTFLPIYHIGRAGRSMKSWFLKFIEKNRKYRLRHIKFFNTILNIWKTFEVLKRINGSSVWKLLLK